MRRTFIPSSNFSASEPASTMFPFTTPPPSSSMTDDTYGTGTLGAARWTMVKDRSVPVVASALGSNSSLPHRAQALRRSKNSAPQLVQAWATRWGSPSSTR